MQHRRQLSRQPRLQYPPTFEPVACSPCVRAAARRAHHMSVGPQSRHCAPLRPQGHATFCDSFRATPLWQDCVSAVSATLSPPLCTVTRANGLHHYLPLESLFLLCTRRVRPVYSCSRRQTMGVVMQDQASRVHYRPWQSNKPPANELTILCSMRSSDQISNWTGCVGKQNKFGITNTRAFQVRCHGTLTKCSLQMSTRHLLLRHGAAVQSSNRRRNDAAENRQQASRCARCCRTQQLKCACEHANLQTMQST